MAGVKGRSGRKLSLKTRKRLIELKLDDLVLSAYDVLEERIIKYRDKEAAIYVINRREGTPHQSVDHRIKGKVVFTGDDYELIAKASIDEQKLLAQYTVVKKEEDAIYSGEDNALKQGEEQGEDEATQVAQANRA